MADEADTSTDRPNVTERGELSLTLDGVDMIMRPTYEAIEAFEAATDKGILQLAHESLNRKLKLGEIAQIACECIRAWGREVENKDAAGANPKRIGNLILDAPGGVLEAAKTVGAMLSLASTGNYTAMGEVKAGTTMTTGLPAESLQA
jgi:hypothetical protein